MTEKWLFDPKAREREQRESERIWNDIKSRKDRKLSAKEKREMLKDSKQVFIPVDRLNYHSKRFGKNERFRQSKENYLLMPKECKSYKRNQVKIIDSITTTQSNEFMVSGWVYESWEITPMTVWLPVEWKDISYDYPTNFLDLFDTDKPEVDHFVWDPIRFDPKDPNANFMKDKRFMRFIKSWCYRKYKNNITFLGGTLPDVGKIYSHEDLIPLVIEFIWQHGHVVKNDKGGYMITYYWKLLELHFWKKFISRSASKNNKVQQSLLCDDWSFLHDRVNSGKGRKTPARFNSENE